MLYHHHTLEEKLVNTVNDCHDGHCLELKIASHSWE